MLFMAIVSNLGFGFIQSLLFSYKFKKKAKIIQFIT